MACAMRWIRGCVSKWVQDVPRTLALYGVWVGLGALAALTAYQVYGTLIYLGLVAVETPSLRPPGWNTATIHGLSRFLILVLGCCWLFLVYWMLGYLREGMAERKLWRRAGWLVLSFGAVYGLSYGALVLLSRF